MTGVASSLPDAIDDTERGIIIDFNRFRSLGGGILP